MDNNYKYGDTWIAQRADPHVFLGPDGYYYFTASVPEYDKIILRRSKTLAGLADSEEKTIWVKHESGLMSKHIWAPEIHYLFDKWYIYFAAGEEERKWEIRPFVLECQGNNPWEDEWVEKGKIQRSSDDIYSFEAFSLDAHVFEVGGEWYYVWAEKVSVGIQISNLYIAKMKDGHTLKTAQVLLTTPDYDWERAGIWVNEGPATLIKDGKIYLTYSAADTGANYCIGMLTASVDSDLLDPKSWDKERYPVFKTDAEKLIFGPGHNSFTVDEVGNDIMVFHARSYEKIEGDPLYDPNRHARLLKVAYDETGKPVFNI